MKKLLLIPLAFLLVGCTAYIPEKDMDKAIEVLQNCINAGGSGASVDDFNVGGKTEISCVL